MILTCGHIFREWNDRTKIHVDFFGPEAEQQVLARVIKYDLKSDVALLSVPTRRTLRIAKVAKEKTVAPNQNVLATGCEHGRDVEAFPTRVTKVDKYLGPPNLCIAGQPQQGRSGGGLFDTRGQVVGVCNAADKEDNEGLYAALGAIDALLDQSQLGFIYREDAKQPIFDRELDRISTIEPPQLARAMPGTMRATNPVPNADLFMAATRPNESRNAEVRNAIPADPAARFAQGLSRPITSTQVETSQATSGSAEVILTIRSHDDPQGQARVVHLANVGPEFLEHVAAAQRTQMNSSANASVGTPRGPTNDGSSRGDARMVPTTLTRPGESLLPAGPQLRRDVSANPAVWPR
ncbi:MAG: serine protease [Pirellulales bacterium]